MSNPKTHTYYLKWGFLPTFFFCLAFFQIGAFLQAAPKDPVQKDAELRVVILGSGEDGAEEIDKISLIKLLRRIKEVKPDVLFFSGNLIGGLEQSTSLESINLFEARLNEFIGLVRTHLGDIPLYPVLGNHTFVNARAVDLFKQKFNIHNVAPLDSYQLAYSVGLDGIRFIVLASGIFERMYQGYRHPLRTMPILDWLEKELRTGRYRFQFVIGHLPAFSTRASEGVFVGMDKETKRRDLFWKVLTDNGVLGYFSSHEDLYDRSNRNGVWQIISGGIGGKKQKQEGLYNFEHFMLLTIPVALNKNPSMRAVDLSGRGWDEFEIIPMDRPVHNLRISGGGSSF